MDYLHTNYRNFSTCRMLPQGSSAMSNALIIIITPSLFNLHWLPINHRIQFKILLLCYKALNGQAPDYLSELLKHKIPSRYSLRMNNDRFLLQQTTLRTLSTLGDRSFTVAGPELWNSLPLQIRSSTNISTFKPQLKTYLFRKAYNWVL